MNTGLPKDIVQQIMKAEQIPVKKMEYRKEKVQDKMNLLEQFTQLVEGMRGEVLKNKSARSLRELKVNTNEEILNVVADKNIANPGSYKLEVMELAQKSSAMTNGVKDKDQTYLGVGYISYKLPNGEKKEIYVDKENSSLSGVARLINQSDIGINATVVNDGKDSKKPYRLILSLDETGKANKANFPYFYFVDGQTDLYLDQERPAQNAKVKLDGFEIELAENKLSDVIPGVTVDLKKAKPGEEVSIEISEDTVQITEKVSTLVESINEVLTFIREQNAVDESTDTSRTLGGDSSLKSLEARLRGTIFTPVETSFGNKRIGDLGIVFNRNGTLDFDEQKFEKEVAGNYKLVSEILTGYYKADGVKTDGFVERLDEVANQALRPPTGLLHSRKTGLRQNINQIDQRISDKQRQLEQKERVLKEKFTRLEETVSRIKGQGAGLAGFGAMPNPAAPNMAG